MTDTPAWLAPGNDAAPAPAPAPAASATTGSPTMGSMNLETSATTTSDSPEDKDLPSVILMMRLLNMGAAAALIAISIFNMVGIPPISTFVLAIYATCGGILICCLETQLKFVRVMIAVNFGFLFNSVWRFLFYMILGSLTWSYDNLGGKIVAAVMGGVACFNTYVLCRYPAYRRIREKIAEEEDKRIEAKISKEVRKQAIKQVTGKS